MKKDEKVPQSLEIIPHVLRCGSHLIGQFLKYCNGGWNAVATLWRNSKLNMCLIEATANNLGFRRFFRIANVLNCCYRCIILAFLKNMKFFFQGNLFCFFFSNFFHYRWESQSTSLNYKYEPSCSCSFFFNCTNIVHFAPCFHCCRLSGMHIWNADEANKY